MSTDLLLSITYLVPETHPVFTHTHGLLVLRYEVDENDDPYLLTEILHFHNSYLIDAFGLAMSFPEDTLPTSTENEGFGEFLFEHIGRPLHFYLVDTVERVNVRNMYLAVLKDGEILTTAGFQHIYKATDA